MDNDNTPTPQPEPHTGATGGDRRADQYASGHIAKDARVPERGEFDDESPGFREAHERIHDRLAGADPTRQGGAPWLLTGFIAVMVVALVALLIVAWLMF